MFFFYLFSLVDREKEKEGETSTSRLQRIYLFCFLYIKYNSLESFAPFFLIFKIFVFLSLKL